MMGVFFYIGLLLIISYIIYRIYLKKKLFKWCKNKVSLVGKTVIITGGNQGIGYETALELAKRGARIILACRNEQRGTEAVEKLKNQTQNQNIHLKILDLASFKSIRSFAEEVLKTEQKIDVLINNAGIILEGDKLSEDGLQVEWECNHFGPVLLTLLLLDRLKESAPSRILNLSSAAAKFADLSLSTLNTYSSHMITYGNTKLANIFFTQQLAEKLYNTGVSVFSVHPGGVATDIVPMRFGPRLRPFARYALKIIHLTVEEGAQTSVYCATEQGIEHLSGEHFEYCAAVEPYKKAQDSVLSKQIWDETLKIIKYKWKDY